MGRCWCPIGASTDTWSDARSQPRFCALDIIPRSWPLSAMLPNAMAPSLRLKTDSLWRKVREPWTRLVSHLVQGRKPCDDVRHPLDLLGGSERSLPFVFVFLFGSSSNSNSRATFAPKGRRWGEWQWNANEDGSRRSGSGARQAGLPFIPSHPSIDFLFGPSPLL